MNRHDLFGPRQCGDTLGRGLHEESGRRNCRSDFDTSLEQGLPRVPEADLAVDEDYCEVVSRLGQLSTQLNCWKQSCLGVDTDAGIRPSRPEVLEAGVDERGAEVLDAIGIRGDLHPLGCALQGVRSGVILSR